MHLVLMLRIRDKETTTHESATFFVGQCIRIQRKKVRSHGLFAEAAKRAIESYERSLQFLITRRSSSQQNYLGLTLPSSKKVVR